MQRHERLAPGSFSFAIRVQDNGICAFVVAPPAEAEVCSSQVADSLRGPKNIAKKPSGHQLTSIEAALSLTVFHSSSATYTGSGSTPSLPAAMDLLNLKLRLRALPEIVFWPIPHNWDGFAAALRVYRCQSPFHTPALRFDLPQRPWPNDGQ